MARRHNYENYSAEHHAAAKAVYEKGFISHDTALWMTQPFEHGDPQYIPDPVETLYLNSTVSLLKPAVVELKLFIFFIRHEEDQVVFATSEVEARELFEKAQQGKEYPYDIDSVERILEFPIPTTPTLIDWTELLNQPDLTTE